MTLAARTEFIFHEFAGQIEERKDHLVIRTPSNPTYHWGNLLLYPKAPRRDDFDAWMADQRAAWCGAFLADVLVGNMGLFFDRSGELGRFQDVDTHANHRRKGVCSTLLFHILERASRDRPNAQLVIITEEDNPARSVYESVGFKQVETMFGLSLDRPLQELAEPAASSDSR